jgi:hypothetical protein
MQKLRLLHRLTEFCLSAKVLLALAGTVILRSESHGTYDQILPSQIRDSPNLENQVLVFISPSILSVVWSDKFVLASPAQ